MVVADPPPTEDDFRKSVIGDFGSPPSYMALLTAPNFDCRRAQNRNGRAKKREGEAPAGRATLLRSQHSQSSAGASPSLCVLDGSKSCRMFRAGASISRFKIERQPFAARSFYVLAADYFVFNCSYLTLYLSLSFVCLLDKSTLRP
jgi:hypothetical protein